jgi:hypothetical protein
MSTIAVISRFLTYAAFGTIGTLAHTFFSSLLKQKFNPDLLPKTDVHLNWALAEIKGSDVRSKLRASSRRQRSHAVGFLDSFLDILERHQIRLIGKVMVKGIGLLGCKCRSFDLHAKIQGYG